MHSRFKDIKLTSSLPIQIADILAQEIVEDRIQPGERLKEIELSTGFNVSRATIREAHRILENKGLVTIVPQHGVQVTQLSRTELEEMFNIRVVLVGLASRTLANNIDSSKALRLKEAESALTASVHDSTEYARASASIAIEITELGGNKMLADMLRSFSQRIGRYARLGLSTESRRARSLKVWTTLFEAICAGDSKRSEEIHRMLSEENKKASLQALDERASLHLKNDK